jgi:hypothetical protein
MAASVLPQQTIATAGEANDELNNSFSSVMLTVDSNNLVGGFELMPNNEPPTNTNECAWRDKEAPDIKDQIHLSAKVSVLACHLALSFIE